MLTKLYQALARQLTPLDLPIFLADCVPEGAIFPYLTAAISPSAHPGGAGELILTLWCRGGAANADRLRLTDTLLELLPARGIRLPLEPGMATLRLKSSDCTHSKDALGMQLAWTLRCHPAS